MERTADISKISIEGTADRTADMVAERTADREADRTAEREAVDDDGVARELERMGLC